MIRFLQTPSKTKKIVLGGLLLIICAAMVITLIPGIGLSDFTGSTSGALARVGSEDVTSTEVQALAKNMGRRQFPKGVPEMLQPYFLQNAAESVIMQKAMLFEAKRMGLSVSDAELQDELHHGQFGEVLFPNGNFIGQDQYADLISQNFNMSIQQFEQTMKQQMVIDKLQGAIAAGVAVSDAEIKKEYQKQNAKVKFEYAILTADDLKKTIKPTDAELKSFYDQNKARYQNSIPEKRKATYIVVDSSKLLSELQAKVTPDQLQQYYNQHKDEFKVPDEVKAAHILIKTPAPGPDGKVDQKGVDAAKAKAESILKQLRGGANFAELAKKESQDPGSAAKGGDLGWFQHGTMVPEFDKAAFSQPVGQVGDLVRTSFGFHIIKVEDKHAAGVKPFAEVKDQIAKKIVQDEAAKQAQGLANKVLTDARKNGMEKAAADNHLQVYNSDWFARTDALPGVGASTEFMNTVFSNKPDSQPMMLQTATGVAAGNVPTQQWAVVKPTAVQPAQTPTFEQIKAKVEEDFKNSRVQQLLAQKTQELADRAHAEHDLKKAAKEAGATVKTSDLVNASGQVPDIGAMSGPASAAFDLKQGEISGPLPLGSSGAVLQVVEKQEPSDADFSKDHDSIRDRLFQEKAQARMQMFVSGLRQRLQKEGKIKINQQEWTRVVGAPAQS